MYVESYFSDKWLTAEFVCIVAVLLAVKEWGNCLWRHIFLFSDQFAGAGFMQRRIWIFVAI